MFPVRKNLDFIFLISLIRHHHVQVLRFGALTTGIVFGARKLEILREMEKNGELPHQQGSAHGHSVHSVLETETDLTSKKEE